MPWHVKGRGRKERGARMEESLGKDRTGFKKLMGPWEMVIVATMGTAAMEEGEEEGSPLPSSSSSSSGEEDGEEGQVGEG